MEEITRKPGTWLTDANKLIEERAFYTYIHCDRSIRCVQDQLPEQLDDDEEMPSRATLYRWMNDQGWDIRATQFIAEHAKQSLAKDLARLVTLRGKALRLASEIIDGYHDTVSPGVLNSKVMVLTSMLNLSGLGTAGYRVGMDAVGPRTEAELVDNENISHEDRIKRLAASLND